ncbi:hypothetical protein LCGC14_2436320 [marine sediment metagenome]|uniref:Uncharacterized protein n=1 Tax=marine sediment metagenome TaxID=412755 RepID=A0A0F9BKC2_9ZZZZ
MRIAEIIEDLERHIAKCGGEEVTENVNTRDLLAALKGEAEKDAPGGPAKEEDPHWPYIHSVAGDMHRNCGGQLRYRVLNDDHDDRKYQCDKCGKQWVEEGSDA